MKQRVLFGIAVVLVLALVVVGLSSADTLLGRRMTGGPSPDDARDTVETFFNAYLAYAQTGNPMVDRAYRDMPGLSAAFVDEVDAMLDSEERIMFDPFLCAQDVPGQISLDDVAVQGDSATVTVASLWQGNPMASLLEVELASADGAWEISDIVCQPGAVRPLTAGETVASFYGLYLQLAQRENPLVTGSYAYLPFLSAEFVAEVQEALANMQGGGFDPILLAQDVPMWVVVESEAVDGNRATVTAVSSFDGHRLAVDLLQRDGAWEIVAVARAAQ